MESLYRDFSKERSFARRLFEGASESLFAAMEYNVFLPEETFVKAGQPATHITILLSGRATGMEWPIDGKPYPFQDFGAGDFFGEIEALAGMKRYRIAVVGQSRGSFVTIPSTLYLKWLEKEPERLLERTRINLRRLLAQTRDARKYLFLDSKERLMLYLIRYMDLAVSRSGERIFTKTRPRMAEEIGYSLKTLNRAIEALKDEGLLEMNKGKIVVKPSGYRNMKEIMERRINQKEEL